MDPQESIKDELVLTPTLFFLTVVEPSYLDLLRHPTDQRAAFCAILSAYHLHEMKYWYDHPNQHPKNKYCNQQMLRERSWRGTLFNLLGDLANAYKHYKRKGKNNVVQSLVQVTGRGGFSGGFDHFAFDVYRLQVEMDDGSLVCIESTLRPIMKMWRCELGLPVVHYEFLEYPYSINSVGQD